VVHWRGQLDEPLLPPAVEHAFRAAARSCEAIVARAA
jgi:hypothetical protein